MLPIFKIIFIFAFNLIVFKRILSFILYLITIFNYQNHCIIMAFMKGIINSSSLEKFYLKFHYMTIFLFSTNYTIHILSLKVFSESENFILLYRYTKCQKKTMKLFQIFVVTVQYN